MSGITLALRAANVAVADAQGYQVGTDLETVLEDLKAPGTHDAAGTASLSLANICEETIALSGDTTGAGYTVTLPTPAGTSQGLRIVFKKTGVGANAVTIATTGAEQIDGGATYTAIDAQNDAAEFHWDGSGWILLNSTLA